MSETHWAPAVRAGIRIRILDDEAVIDRLLREPLQPVDQIPLGVAPRLRPLLGIEDRKLHGVRSVDDIAGLLLARFDVEEPRLRRDLSELLQKLKALGVLT